MAYRRDIDGLRAVAVVPVVFFHANAPYLTGGFVGVDVFFVISGFLIAGILKRELEAGSFSLLGFYERRARRILPALFVVIAATLVAGAVLLLPAVFASLGRSAIAAVLFVSNIWAFHSATDYFDAGITPLLHTWSLAVEEQFYLVFPVLLAALSRWLPRQTWGILAAICLASFTLSVVQVSDDNPIAFYMAQSRAWELGIGVLLAIAPRSLLRRRWHAELLGIVGLVAIAASMLLYTRSTPFPGVAALAPTLGAAAVIYAGVSTRTLATRLLTFPPLVFVGLISYSLYLWHLPILTFARVRVTAADFTNEPKLWAIGASFLLATATWWFIERPFRRRKWLTRTQVFALSGAGGLVVATLATVVLIGDGFASRLPAEVRSIIAATTSDGRRCMARANDDLCEMGADVAPTVLLWGDSHGNSAIPAFQQVLLEAGVGALAAVHLGCPPLLEVSQPADPSCDAFRAAIREEILAHPEWTTVVLSARWAAWASSPTEGARDDLVLADARLDATTVDAFDHGLKSTVEWLLGLGRRVLIVGPVPEPGWNVPDQLAAQIRWAKPLPPITTMVTYNARNETVFRTFAELEGRPGLTIMPVADRFCTPECAVSIDGQPVYVDDSHLSRLAALTYLAPSLATYPWRL